MAYLLVPNVVGILFLFHLEWNLNTPEHSHVDHNLRGRNGARGDQNRNSPGLTLRLSECSES